MIVLGIETSCDETAVGIVKDGTTLLANAVFSSMDLHKAYGGVVPEIAARSHIEAIIPVIEQALGQAFQGSTLERCWDKIDAIAVTYGAGLGGSLLVGVMAARTLAITKKKPLYAINHVEAHVYANFLTATALNDYQLPASAPEFPLLALIVSGGHTQLVLFNDHFDYTLLGQTRDDAIGEAFDKVAKIIGLPYPGGPSVAKAAISGNPYKYKFPKSKLDHKYEFSFSGVKTAVLRLAQKEIGEDFTYPSIKVPERLSKAQRIDIAASFQRIAMETVVDKTLAAFEEFQPKSVVIAGGVAANQELRRQLSERIPIEIQYTDIKLCTDNGAMIATLGCFKAMLEQEEADPYSLEIEPNLSM
jgi:N6-L-threonylcarbamoyladenine synthase